MAAPTRFERATCPLGGDRSIQLSYGAVRRGIIAENRAWPYPGDWYRAVPETQNARISPGVLSIFHWQGLLRTLAALITLAALVGLRRRLGVVGRRRGDQATAHQQRLDVRIAAGEVMEQRQRVLAAATREQGVAEVVAVGAGQAAVLLHPFHAVGVEHFRPDVGVVAGCVAAHDVAEVGRAVTRRHRREIQAVLLQ